MSSVGPNLVTSLKFKSIRCATTLCHFGRTRNGYLSTRIILLSSTAESSATSDHVVVPDRSGQNEEPDGRNEERAKKKPSFVPSSRFNRCNVKTHVNMNFIHFVMYFTLCILLPFGAFFVNFLLWNFFFDFLFTLFFIVSARE